MQDPISAWEPTNFTKNQKYILALLTLVGAAIRFYEIGKESIWFDEALSMLFAHQPLALSTTQMLQEGLHHTPFYYLLLRPFMFLSYTETSARSLSAILGILSIPMLAYLGKTLLSPKIGLIAAALLTIDPFHVWYSRETRMYALLAFVAIAAMYFFSANMFRKPAFRNWVGLAIVLAIGINTHHFAYYLILCQFVFILLTFKTNYKILRPWATTNLIAGLSLVPWLMIAIGAGNFYGSGSATEVVQFVEPLKTFWNFSIGYTVSVTPVVLISLGLFLLVMLMGLRPRRSGPELFITVSMLLPPILTFLISFRLPMYVDRYLIVALPAFILAVAVGLARIRPNWLAYGAAAMIAAAMLIGLGRVYFDETVYKKADWRNVAAYIGQEIDPEKDVLITLNFVDIVPFSYYFKEDIPIQPLKVYSEDNLPDLDQQLLDSENARIFLILSYPNNSTHLVGHCQPYDPATYPPETAIRNWIDSLQSKRISIKEFPCVAVAIYQY